MASEEKIVAQLDELEEGAVKQVKVNDIPILLSRRHGEIRAFGGCCSHYGAPLIEGIASGNHIRCPWHHARFSLENGEVEDPPGLDSLATFPVRVHGNDILMTVPEKAELQCEPVMSKWIAAHDSRTFVILGGGAAGSYAAETLRREGFEGRIVMISREGRLPYDRTLLSKNYLSSEKTKGYMPLRDEQFYQQYDIEVSLNTVVEGVDCNHRRIQFSDGGEMEYDALLIATGGAPRELNVPGAELGNIFLLRTPEHADAIIEQAQSGAKAVVIGASFIATECAANLRARDVDVTMVAPESLPFKKVLGSALGQLFRSLHETNKVTFKLESKVSHFEGNGQVQAVVLEGGERLPADFVIVAIGVTPVTDFLDLPKCPDGGIEVDAEMKVTACDGSVFAAGDIAVFPDPHGEGRERIEHWRVAQQEGMIAARAMLGETTSQNWIPFFWTNQYDLKLRYVGHASEWDELVIDGNLDAQDFLIYYIKNNRLAAAAGSGRDKAMDAIEECMLRKMMPKLDELQKGSVDWLAQLKQS